MIGKRVGDWLTEEECAAVLLLVGERVPTIPSGDRAPFQGRPGHFADGSRPGEWESYYRRMTDYKRKVIQAMVDLELVSRHEVTRFAQYGGNGYAHYRVDNYMKWVKKQVYGVDAPLHQDRGNRL